MSAYDKVTLLVEITKINKSLEPIKRQKWKLKILPFYTPGVLEESQIIMGLLQEHLEDHIECELLEEVAL